MDERPDEQTSEARQRRLDALRGLAREAAPVTPDTPPGGASSRAPALPAARPLRSGWRRWLAPASALVVVLVVVGVVVGAILRQSALWPVGQRNRPLPALTSKAYGLGANSCPSTPAWSPDGKSLALLVTPQPNLSYCHSLNSVTAIAWSSTDETINGPPPTAFAIVIVDAATGHITRTITLPALTVARLCPGATMFNDCGVAPISVGWSPDGKTVAAFFTYTYFYSDNVHEQARGALIVAPADGSGSPRLLVAYGRVKADQTPNDYKLGLIWSSPRFTWNLTTGAGSYSDIHMGLYIFTTLFAQGYRLETDSSLTLDQQAQADDMSAWQEGVLLKSSGANGSKSVYSYQVSQWLWSADGRYVTPNLDTAAYVAVPGVTGDPPADIPRIVNQPSVSPPDAATAQSVQAVAKLAVSAALARNPNGNLLATYTCDDAASQLTIRAVGSGAIVAQARYTNPLTSYSQGCSGDIGAITWSPDGARIATVDAPDSQLIIWRMNFHA